MEWIYIISIVGTAIIAIFIGWFIGQKKMFEEMNQMIEKERQDAVKRSRQVLEGKFSEHLSPILPGFPVEPSEANFLGSPVDFVAFKGKGSGKIEEIVFVEVKSSSSTLTKREREIKKAVENNQVRFEEYRVPDFREDRE